MIMSFQQLQNLIQMSFDVNVNPLSGSYDRWVSLMTGLYSNICFWKFSESSWDQNFRVTKYDQNWFKKHLTTPILSRTIQLTESHAGNPELGLIEIAKSLTLGPTPARLNHRLAHAQNYAYFQKLDSDPLDSDPLDSTQPDIPAVHPVLRNTFAFKTVRRRSSNLPNLKTLWSHTWKNI